jgi:hypothetical protein
MYWLELKKSRLLWRRKREEGRESMDKTLNNKQHKDKGNVLPFPIIRRGNAGGGGSTD